MPRALSYEITVADELLIWPALCFPCRCSALEPPSCAGLCSARGSVAHRAGSDFRFTGPRASPARPGSSAPPGLPVRLAGQWPRAAWASFLLALLACFQPGLDRSRQRAPGLPGLVCWAGRWAVLHLLGRPPRVGPPPVACAWAGRVPLPLGRSRQRAPWAEPRCWDGHRAWAAGCADTCLGPLGRVGDHWSLYFSKAVSNFAYKANLYNQYKFV